MQNAVNIKLINDDETTIFHCADWINSSSVYNNKKGSKQKRLQLRKVKKIKLKNVC